MYTVVMYRYSGLQKLKKMILFKFVVLKYSYSWRKCK